MKWILETGMAVQYDFNKNGDGRSVNCPRAG